MKFKVPMDTYRAMSYKCLKPCIIVFEKIRHWRQSFECCNIKVAVEALGWLAFSKEKV